MLIRTSLAAVLAVANLAFAEPDPAAKAKLQAASDAIRAAKSISYKVESKGEGGMLAGFMPKSTATVHLERSPSDGKLWMTRVEGRSTPALGSEGAKDFLVIGNGVTKAWKDEAQKAVVERLNYQAGGEQVDLANNGCALEFFEAEPFAKEMSVGTITLEAPAEVGGVMCDVVRSDDGRQRPHRVFIAQSDHLPRRIEHRIEDGTMNDAQVWLMTDVKINEPAPAGSFAISTPEGWRYLPATPPATATTPKGGDGTTTTAAAPLSPRQRAVGVNVQDLAPDFELANETGEKVKLSGLHESVVVLDFWGTWCLPCRRASPELQKLVDDYKGKPVKAFGLAVRETTDEKPIAYMKEGNYTYGLLLKADEVAKLYRVKAYPTYFVVGKSGEVVYSVAGYDDKTFPAIRRAVDAALEGKPMPAEEPKAEAPAPSKPAAGDDKPGAAPNSKGVAKPTKGG